MDKKLFAFRKGGVRLSGSKITESVHISNSNIPKVVHIPMSQHQGAPAKLLVRPGQDVEEGQLIGEANGFISANVHASVSGRVVSIDKKDALNVKGVEYVTIQTGGSFRNWYGQKHPFSASSPQDLLDDIQKAGVVGLGGATFPTHVKLTPPKGKKITHLLVNAAECEPYLTSDRRIVLEKTEGLLEGIRIIAKILGLEKSVICVEDSQPDALGHLAEVLKDEKAVSAAALRTRYPQGGERQLVQAVLGIEVPSGGLPLDVGVLVENVATVLAVCEAVVYKKPLIERCLSYTGENVPNAGNYKVRIGTPFQQLVEDCGIPERHGTIIAGGPMMGIEIADLSLPVTKSTTGVVVLPRAKDYKVRDLPCIRCSRCLDACPARLQPTMLARLCDQLRAREAADGFHLLDCIECGCCGYVCPSAIPLVGLIRYGKEFIRRQQARLEKMPL